MNTKLTILGGALFLTACLDTEAAERGYGAANGEPVIDTLDPSPPQGVFTTDGTYAVSTTLDVEAQILFPATAYDAMLILEGLRDHPAMTLFDLAEDAGVPAVGTIRSALPSALESRLYGWIDGHVQSVTTGDGTIAQVITTVLDVCHADLAELHLDSQLTIAGGAAAHRLDTVELEVQGRTLAFDVAPLAGIGVELDVPVTATCSADGALALGAHGWSFPYGKIAWQATEELVMARYGRDLRGVLGAQVGCAAMAQVVASKCFLSQCVGHAAELTAICESGLDHAVAQIRDRVEAYTVAPISLDSGTAVLAEGHIDDNRADDVTAGVWTARLDLSQGLRPAPATFTGSRQ